MVPSFDGVVNTVGGPLVNAAYRVRLRPMDAGGHAFPDCSGKYVLSSGGSVKEGSKPIHIELRLNGDVIATNTPSGFNMKGRLVQEGSNEDLKWTIVGFEEALGTATLTERGIEFAIGLTWAKLAD